MDSLILNVNGEGDGDGDVGLEVLTVIQLVSDSYNMLKLHEHFGANAGNEYKWLDGSYVPFSEPRTSDFSVSFREN